MLNSRMTDEPTNQNAGKPFLHQVGRNFNINTPIHLTYMQQDDKTNNISRTIPQVLKEGRKAGAKGVNM